ncbi:ATP-binding protein [Luteimonas sp. JM171]|uniref:ATP-binding protein n=1 Tax=Luteimonas sp. JM171 TaxID=1896164 RepID=UPI0012FAE259|nr:ATP-binding protein [Luteimonas sp. JM171]
MNNANLHDLEETEFGKRIHAVLFPSSPIQSHEFLFGRDDQLERIRRALMAPGRQVFIYGERGVGKSSLAGAAAVECQSSDAVPLHASCGSNSSFAGVVSCLIRATGNESSSSVTVHKKRGVEGKGLSLARHVETNTQPATAPLDIEDAAQRLDAAFSAYSKRTVAVIDEFDLIPEETERNKFAELIKALGDRKSEVKLIFTGVASALDELLASHASAHRQLDTIQLERLAYQPRLDITNKALGEFDLDADPSVVYRIGNVSNGFPYYVHLLTEHLLWAWYGDAGAQQVTMGHLHEAFIKATDAVHADLRKPYDEATRGRDQAAYVLWATADAFDLERTTDAIWKSYMQICDTLDVDALEKKKFLSQLRNLKTDAKGEILEGIPSRRLYRFREAMVRGYVRMAAARKNIQLDDQEFDPPPQATIHTPRMSGRKRWMDTSRFVPNIKMGAQYRR